MLTLIKKTISNAENVITANADVIAWKKVIIILKKLTMTREKVSIVPKK